MSATKVPTISSATAETEPSPGQARLELDLRLRHPQQQQQQQQQQPVAANYTSASANTPKSRSRRPLKTPTPKKQPQRGLGVAQLERLRLQERWKKLIEVPDTQQQHPCPTTAPLANDPQNVQNFQYLQPGVNKGGTQHAPPPAPSFLYPVMEGVGGGVLPQCESGGCCLPLGVFGMGRGFVVGNPLSGGWDGVNNGVSRELSSMPNVRALMPNHTDHNIYLAAGMNGKVKPVVGGVVMEYEFFPGKRCRNTWNEAHCMPTVGGGRGGTSDSAAAVAAATEASNSIDLSLKL